MTVNPAATSTDYLIIGGGSAGCVMASRLSEDSSVQVTLLEAGFDPYATGAPAAILDAGVRTIFNPALFWPNLMAVNSAQSDGSAGQVIPFSQARVIGGGSTINGLHAQRGLPRDYDEWVELGAAGWGWGDVLPYFLKLENDRDFAGPQHGQHGPVEIGRVPESEWGGLSLGVRIALGRRGLNRLADMNVESGDGMGPLPLNSPTGRVSAATAYLTDNVRRRPNLRIISDTSVTRLSMEGNRAMGAEFRNGGREFTILASETIVCCGAIHSPALLLRSGIGPSGELRKFGIAVAADRPGVGRNLQNHPMVSITSHLRRAGRAKGTVRPPCLMVTRYSSEVHGCPPTDMLLNVTERVPGSLARDPLGHQFGDLMFILNKPCSRGQVSLDPADTFGMPKVQFNTLGDQRDVERVAQAFALGCALLRDAAVAPLINQTFVIKPTPVVFGLLQDNSKARVLSTLGAFALSGPSFLRKRLLRGNIAIPDPGNAAAMEQFARACALPSGHPAGTCRLGDPADPDTVTDSACRVVGVDGLRVVDASIFPTLMSAGTNLPTMMAAEKVAAMAIAERRGRTPVRSAHLIAV